MMALLALIIHNPSIRQTAYKGIRGTVRAAGTVPAILALTGRPTLRAAFDALVADPKGPR